MASPESHPNLERYALIVATLTSFMGPFMIASVNVALPAIQSDLQLNAVQLSWVGTAYLLAVAVVLVPAGKIADIYGRKRIFTLGLIVYTLGAFCGAFAHSPVTFIGLRVVQGIGAAMFVTTGMAILTSIYPPQKRGKAIGIYVAAVYIGLSVGPFAGGMMTNYWGWRSIFLIMLPFGLFSFLVTQYLLKGEWYGAPGEKLDVTGCFLYALSILALVYGATRLPAPLGLGLVTAGGVLLLIFIRHQLSANHPVFDVSLFAANRSFTFSSLAALLNYSATFAVTFLMSLYLQYIKGMAPQTAGTVLMAQPIMMALLSPLAGRLSDRIEPRYLATGGMSLTVLGIAVFSRIGQTTPLGLIIANLVVLGIGFALFSSPNMSTIMGSVEKRYYGLASGTVATMRLLGQMFSMALATVVLALFIGRQPIIPDNYPLFLKSVHTVFTISASLCLVGIYFSWFRGPLNEIGSKEPGKPH